MSQNILTNDNHFNEWSFFNLFIATLLKNGVSTLRVSHVAADLVPYFHDPYYKDLFALMYLHYPHFRPMVNIIEAMNNAAWIGLIEQFNPNRPYSRQIRVGLQWGERKLNQFTERQIELMDHLVKDYIEKYKEYFHIDRSGVIISGINPNGYYDLSSEYFRGPPSILKEDLMITDGNIDTENSTTEDDKKIMPGTVKFTHVFRKLHIIDASYVIVKKLIGSQTRDINLYTQKPLHSIDSLIAIGLQSKKPKTKLIAKSPKVYQLKINPTLPDKLL